MIAKEINNMVAKEINNKDDFINIDLDDYFDNTGEYKKPFKKIRGRKNIMITRSKDTPLIIGDNFLACSNINKINFDNTNNVIEIKDNFLKHSSINHLCITYNDFKHLNCIGSDFMYNATMRHEKYHNRILLAFHNLRIIGDKFMAFATEADDFIHFSLDLPNISRIGDKFMYCYKSNCIRLNYIFDNIQTIGQHFLETRGETIQINTTLDLSDFDEKILIKNENYKVIEKTKINTIKEIGYDPSYDFIIPFDTLYSQRGRSKVFLCKRNTIEGILN